MEQPFDDIFAQSYHRIMGSGAYNPEFIGRFYDLFLDSSPDVAARFKNTDMSHQKTMLHDSLNTLVDFSEHRIVNAQMERLAVVHGPGAADVQPALYGLWLDSLIRTVRDFDSAYDENVDLAWRLTLAPGISYLQFTYAHPPR